MSSCPDSDIANNRVQRIQGDLLGKIANLTIEQLDLEDSHRFFDPEMARRVALAAVRMRMAAEQLRVAEMYLREVNTDRQQRLVAARSQGAENLVAVSIQPDEQ